MEHTGPQVAANTTEISSENAEDCEMTVGSPGLVAPKEERTDRALRSAVNWLGPRLGVKPGDTKDLAVKILSKIAAPIGWKLRNLCIRDADKAMKFFADVEIDEYTAKRILMSCRKRRHASDADGSGDEGGLMGKKPMGKWI